MAKVSKKKASKKSAKKRPELAGQSAAVQPDVPYDDDEEDLNEADENITSEEEEEDVEDERRHRKLLEAISSLGGKRRKNVGERSEAAVEMSEFTVNAEGEGDKIDLSDLIGTMEKTPAVTAKTQKRLKNLQRSKRTVESPLSRQESERIQRDVAFQKAASEVSQWNAVIRQNQRAEQLVFPLNQEPSGPKPMERVVTNWKAQTPLEKEIFALLSANKQPIHDPVLTPSEEASMRAMSLEEAKIRRAELQKARALQSYYEAKARREGKIKSKKYHKVHNKAKRKDFLKKFDEMAKSDPAAALEELNKMELARMRERMSLKHQNSGKWAKSKAIMAKYDEGARKAMQQQLEVNKELTQKMVASLNNEEEEEEEEEAGDAEVLPDFVNDAERGPDFSNPWMRGKLSEEPAETKTSDAVDLTAAGDAAEEEEEEEVEETEEEALLREFDEKRKRRQDREADPAPAVIVDDEEEEEEGKEKEEEKTAEAAPGPSDEEQEELSEFTSIFRGLAHERREAEVAVDPTAQLDEGLMRIRTLEDVDLLDQEEATGDKTDETPAQPPENPPENPPPQKANKKRKRVIELKEVLTKETKVIQAPLVPTIEDPEDADGIPDQRRLIREAFAGDDVVSDFLKDKRNQEAAGKPKRVDLTLPGWGDWGGLGLKLPRRKRRRFTVKAAPPPPRRDQCLPSVIISEKRSGALGVHQVNSLPFPFQTHAQFEGIIRAPMGRTWNTERTVQKITKPKVVTKLGAIIEPMAREELLKDKKRQVAAVDLREKK